MNQVELKRAVTFVGEEIKRELPSSQVKFFKRNQDFTEYLEKFKGDFLHHTVYMNKHQLLTPLLTQPKSLAGVSTYHFANDFSGMQHKIFSVKRINTIQDQRQLDSFYSAMQLFLQNVKKLFTLTNQENLQVLFVESVMEFKIVLVVPRDAPSVPYKKYQSEIYHFVKQEKAYRLIEIEEEIYELSKERKKIKEYLKQREQ